MTIDCDRWPSDCFCDNVLNCTAALREREPLRNDQWVKGYHAALLDLEILAQQVT